jgi:hypothetical protein
MRLARIVPFPSAPSYNPDFSYHAEVLTERHVREEYDHSGPRIGLAVLVRVFPISGCLIFFLRARLNTQVDNRTNVDAYTGALGF